jgi:Predicted pyridoxal phosphate-dependent enzyme apparently involved in regulation of cell wall biogenesis
MLRNIPFGKPMIGKAEQDAVAGVLQGSVLVHGPKAREFEEAFAAYTKAPQAVSVSSCTAALHLFYFHLGIGHGDEVIVPDPGYPIYEHAVELTGAEPVFIDAEMQTGNINISQIESQITERTKAISVVHYLGMPVEMDGILNLAQKYNLKVVEDCALAVGSFYKGIHAGLYGDAGCFSFYPVKHMTTAEGGMLVTRDKEMAAGIIRKKAFGVDRTVNERSMPGLYDVTMLGFNYRMSEIHAAIGIEQLKKIEDFLRQRQINYEALTAGLREIPEISLFQSTNGDFISSYYCHSVMLSDQLAPKRFEIVKYLNENGVGTSIYYPRPVPHFTYYRQKYGFSLKSFPMAAKISANSIALPVGQHLNEEDMNYIVQILKEAIRRSKS